MNEKKKFNFLQYPDLRKLLLMCGILSSVWYILINIIVPIQYDGYNISSQTVSELSAIDSPTRQLWIFLCVFYSLLLIAFGCGIGLSAGSNIKLTYAALLLIFDGVFGFFWPPMHQRQVIAAGGGTLTDTLHIVWTIIHILLMLIVIALSAGSLGKAFRVYSVLTVITFVVFGMLTTIDSMAMETGAATPYIGIWERVNMASYMLWLSVLAIMLLDRQEKMDVLAADV